MTGAGLFVCGEYDWRDRQWLRALLLLGLGAMALVISGTAILHRVSATQEAHLQLARSNYLPRVEADKALTDAKEALAAASAAAEGVSAALDVAPAVRAWSSGRKPPGSGWSRPRQAWWFLVHASSKIQEGSALLPSCRYRRRPISRSRQRSCPCG